MYPIISLLILILDIIAIIQVIRGSGSPVYKLLWILIILLLPFLGMLLYFLLGNNKSLVK